MIVRLPSSSCAGGGIIAGATAFLLSVNFLFAFSNFISVDFEVPITSMLELCLDPQ